MQRSVTGTLVVAVLALLTATSVTAGEAAKRPLALDDMARVRVVGAPQVSPEGNWIAYTVTTVDVEKDKSDTDLWMVSWDGTRRLRLTNTPDSSESEPRWSPDGRYPAFIATRGEDDEKKGGGQVYLLSRSGGEAQKLTGIKGGVSDYMWSPDGKRLALVVRDFDPSADPEKMEGWKRKTQPPIVIDRYQFKTDTDGYRMDFNTHLVLFDVEAGKAETLTSGASDDTLPSWSPDGRAIAYISRRLPDSDRTENSDVYVIEARAGARPRQVTTFPGRDDGRPAWSPDGKWLAYLQTDETKYTAYYLAKLAVIPAAGGTARVVTGALDRAVAVEPFDAPILWAADGQSVRVIVEDDRVAYVARVTISTGTVEKITTGRRVVEAMAARSDGTLVVLSGTAAEPSEISVVENGTLRRVSHENDEWLAGVQLATTEDFTCTSRDGTVVNGLVAKPAGFVAGKKYPTLLFIHGGPNGQDDHSFDFRREWLAANGYVVLAVNYRGSSGRGAAYQKAIFADWGRKEVMDLLAGVDWAVATGLADPDRLGIGGWSYGGILTDYTIASDTRFKAAVSGASSALQMSLYGVDQYVVQWENEVGLPWKAPEAYVKLSYPFLHADRIRTPTLYMSGDKDFNVPTAGVEQMYQALRSLNIDTQLVIYPGQHHAIAVPSYSRDRLARWVVWFDKYLKK